MQVSVSKIKHRGGVLLLSSALVSACLQVLWFWPRCIHQIDYDGMAYTGIARELKEGLFHASINAFRSPLISWLIAATHLSNVFSTGKAVTLLAYLATIFLIYTFAYQLWHSHLTAGTSALVFTFARGISFYAVAFISPDFLFMGLTLVYFLVLLCCLRGDQHWLLLGAIHAVTFLTKGFALPWFAVLSLTAAALGGGSRERRLSRAGLALIFPVLVACSWSAILHTKYGVFTTGTQFKTNYLQWVARAYRDYRPSTYAYLTDITGNTDDHMVDDPMGPGTWPWSYELQARKAVPAILESGTSIARMRSFPGLAV